MVREFFFVLFVITDPAPITEFSSIVKGATKEVLDPTNTFFFILVLFF